MNEDHVIVPASSRIAPSASSASNVNPMANEVIATPMTTSTGDQQLTVRPRLRTTGQRA